MGWLCVNPPLYQNFGDRSLASTNRKPKGTIFTLSLHILAREKELLQQQRLRLDIKKNFQLLP